MVTGFIKTKEGIEEYSKLDLPYPEELWDTDYDKWVADTNLSELPKYSKHLPIEVVRITRLKTGEDKEYITYCATEYRLDKALNLRHRFRSGFGEYPVPRPIYSIEQGDFGVQNRKVVEVQSIDKGYSIPYSPEAIDKIKSIGLQIEGQIQYQVISPNGLTVTVASYSDLRDGNFDELCAFGHIPSHAQRDQWLKEGGSTATDKKLRDVKLQRDNKDVLQKPVTADQVRQMLKEEHATTSAAAVAAGTASPVTTNTKSKSNSKTK
jgi:hypothetical protein